MSWERLTRDAERMARRRPADDVLQEILERAGEAGEPPPSLEIGRMLEVLAGERAVERMLEIGTGLGLNTVCLARGAARARLVSIADSGRGSDATRVLLESAGVADRVELVEGEPLDAAGRLDGRFDLIHLAAPVELLRRLVDRLLPRLEVGGLLTAEGLAPDTGGVGDSVDADLGEGEAAAAKAMAGYLVMHPQLDCCVLPIGSGLAVGRKKRPLVTEMGGPF